MSVLDHPSAIAGAGVRLIIRERARRAGHVAVMLGAVLGGFASGSAAAQLKEWPATVVTISGRGEVLKRGTSAWAPAKLRLELLPGDGARTATASRLVLRSVAGHVVRMAPLSQVVLQDDEAGPAEQPARLRMDAGWIWVATKPGLSGRTLVEVQAGPVTVSVKGTGVGVRGNADGSVMVRVHHGVAVCAGPGPEKRWERMLTENQEILVSREGAPGEIRALTQERVDPVWIRWNEEQDFAGGYGGKPPTGK